MNNDFLDGSQIVTPSVVDKIKDLQDENNLLKEKVKIFCNLLNDQIQMFEKANEKDGKHTLEVDHDILIRLKNKYIEILEELNS